VIGEAPLPRHEADLASLSLVAAIPWPSADASDVIAMLKYFSAPNAFRNGGALTLVREKPKRDKLRC